MTIERYFADPRHQQSKALAFNADRIAAVGDDAKDLYAEAAALEEAAALALPDVPKDLPDARSFMAVSAVSLWLKAGRPDNAIRVGEAFLTAGGLTPDGRRVLAGYVKSARDAAAR